MTAADEDTIAVSDAPPGPASRLGITIIAGTLIVDQVAKWIAKATLDGGQPFDVLPILGLFYSENTGIAFSFFRGSNSQFLLLGVIAVTIAVLVFWARSREGGKLAAVGYGLIVGGAVGNIVDRVVNGHVVDFLLLHFGDRELFIFNLADTALTLGPLFLIVAFLRPQRRVPKA